MKSVKELHNQAMEFNEKAIFSLKRQDKSASDDFLLKAFELEKEAFELYNKQVGKDPTRSILLKSAINLAVHARLFEEAEKLIGLGLALDVPKDFKAHLRQILRDISFHEYLAEREFQLAPNELKISLSGSGVGNGIIEYHEVFHRIENFQRLVYRTAHRIGNVPFKERLRTSKKKPDLSCSLIAQPVPGSFNVTLRFGTELSKKNPLFPDEDTSSLIIDDILQNIERIINDRMEELESTIPDQAYRRNFVALTSKIAPDGDTVKTMNLVSSRNGSKRHIEFKKPKAQFKLLTGPPKSQLPEANNQEELITLIGTLSFADADKDTIKLTEGSGKKHKITVPEGLLSDIVKPHFQDEVEVQAIKRGNLFTLQDVNPV